MLLFRWSVWGDKKQLSELLCLSVSTFRRAFGAQARYVVGTDEPSALRDMLGPEVEIIPHGELATFGIDGTPTWRKWCPTARLSLRDTEFYVDSDVFLVGDPNEVRRFDHDPNARPFIVMREAPGSSPLVGRFATRVLPGIPPINTGFLGQRPGTDITAELSRELQWWLQNIPFERRTFHDEQGAVVAVLSQRYLLGHVELLSQERYVIVSPRSNPDLTSLDGAAAVHLTMKAFALNRFRHHITAYIAEGLTSAAQETTDDRPAHDAL